MKQITRRIEVLERKGPSRDTGEVQLIRVIVKPSDSGPVEVRRMPSYHAH